MTPPRPDTPWWFPDARGWIGIAVFLLTTLVLMMLWITPDLRKDEFFKVLATLIVGTAFVGGVVSWAYGATKGGVDLAENNASIVKAQAEASPPIEKET